MDAITHLQRPMGILVSFCLAVCLVLWTTPAYADYYSNIRDDRQRIADHRDDSATYRTQARVLFGFAVVIAVVGIALTGGAAAPAVFAGLMSLASAGAGVAELSSARASDRKAEAAAGRYWARYGPDGW